jgi:hypothetical protein
LYFTRIAIHVFHKELVIHGDEMVFGIRFVKKILAKEMGSYGAGGKDMLRMIFYVTYRMATIYVNCT